MECWLSVKFGRHSRSDQRLLACSPPIPSTRARLVTQAVCKIPLTHIRQTAIGSSNERQAHLRTLWPFLAGSSLKSLGKDRLKETAEYDAFAVAESIKQEFGAAIGLVYATRDEFFRPEENKLDQAHRAGVYASTSFEGYHNDFVVNPIRVLGSWAVDAFLNQ